MKQVSLELDDEVWESIPRVARFVNLVQCDQSPATAARLLEYLVRELLIEIEMEEEDNPTPASSTGVDEALQQLLDPNISKPLQLRQVQNITASETGQTLLEYFEVLEASPDPWISRVLAKQEDKDTWKRALAATYAVVQGQERKSHVTWALIERTYLMLKHAGDLTPNGP